MSFVQGRLSNSLPWSVDYTLGNCLRTLYCAPPHTFSELSKLSKDNTRFLPSGRHFDGKGRRSSGGRFSKVAKTFGARKDIRQTPTRFFCKADLFICCKGTKNWNNCRVSCHETPLFWKHRENHVTRNAPVKFRDFRETGPSWKPFYRSPVTGQRRELLGMRTCVSTLRCPLSHLLCCRHQDQFSFTYSYWQSSAYEVMPSFPWAPPFFWRGETVQFRRNFDQWQW